MSVAVGGIAAANIDIAAACLFWGMATAARMADGIAGTASRQGSSVRHIYGGGGCGKS